VVEFGIPGTARPFLYKSLYMPYSGYSERFPETAGFGKAAKIF
jgi:hypothetical protein